jgi:predicted dehydrogenase/NADPH:quinone reductase-like Zn-dependent oxidoreductase
VGDRCIEYVVKQVLQNSSGFTIVRDVPVPACPATNVLVRNEFSVISSGTERSRVQASQKSLLSRVTDRPELALKVVDRARRDGIRHTHDLIRQTLTQESGSGYSSAGTVIELGAAVRGLALGDRVACAGAGYANHAEIVNVPCNLCAKVPDGVPMLSAALTTIASIALHGIRLADVQLGDRVAVVGCGLVGQIACRLLTAAGTTVFALDIDSAHVDSAVAAGAQVGVPVADGATDAVRDATEGLGVDQALVTAASSTSDPLRLATDLARDRGTVVLLGDVRVDIPRNVLYDKELAFRVSRSYGPGRYDRNYEEKGLDYPIGYVRWTEQRNMECVLDLQAQGKLALGDLIDDVMPIEQADEAYARLAGPAETRPRGALAFSYGLTDGHRQDHAPALEGHHRAPRRHGDADAIRIGLIGPGTFATSVLAPALKRAGAVLVAVAGGAGPSAEAMTRDAGFERAATSVEALLAVEEIDAVVIATRHDSHASLVQDALNAGKHVFCEKPLALDPDQLQGVLETAQRAERVLMVGFNRRFAPHIRRVREFTSAEKGQLAAIYRVSAGRLDTQHWVHDLEQGGGRLIGEACHFLDTLSFLADSPITRVHVSGFAVLQQPIQSADNIVLSLVFANGSVGAVVYVSRGAAGLPKERLEIFAGSRTAILDDYADLELYDGANRTRDRLRRQDKGHTAEIEQFLAGVRSGSNPIPIEVIRNIHQSCFAAVDSLRTGLPAQLPAARSHLARDQ